jgi:hypothetical protein
MASPQNGQDFVDDEDDGVDRDDGTGLPIVESDLGFVASASPSSTVGSILAGSGVVAEGAYWSSPDFDDLVESHHTHKPMPSRQMSMNPMKISGIVQSPLSARICTIGICCPS